MPEPFFKKVAALRLAALLKKRLRCSCFPVNFAKVLRTPISQNISGRLLLYCSDKDLELLARKGKFDEILSALSLVDINSIFVRV